LRFARPQEDLAVQANVHGGPILWAFMRWDHSKYVNRLRSGAAPTIGIRTKTAECSMAWGPLSKVAGAHVYREGESWLTF